MTDSPLRESKTWEPNSSERWSDSTPTLPSPLRRVNSQSMDGDGSLEAHTLGQFGVLRAGYLHTGASRWERTDAALGGSQKLRFVVLTRQAVTWFKRSATDVLFGDERGTLPLGEIARVAAGDADPRRVELYGQRGELRRWFLCKAGDDTSEAWRAAIEAARRDAVEGAVDFRGPAPSPSRRAASPTVVSLVKSVAGGDANLISRRVREDEEIRVGEVKTDETLTLVCGDGDLDIDAAVLAEALDVGEAFVEALLGPAAKPVRVKVRADEDDDDDAVVAPAASQTAPAPPPPRRDFAAAAAVLVALLGALWAAFDALVRFEVDGTRRRGPDALARCAAALAGAAAGPAAARDARDVFAFAVLAAAVAPAVRAQARRLRAAARALGDDGDGTLARHDTPRARRLSVTLVSDDAGKPGPAKPKPRAAPRKVDPGDARAVRDASARTGAPGKFIVGTGGDVREASRRWAETSRWRREHDVDAVMGEAHPKFAAIKRHYPHYWCGRGRRGELIYVERVGHVDAAGLKRDGVTIDHLVRHYILLHEFTWSVLAPAPDGPTSYQCVVLDVDGVQLSQCRGIRFDYVRRCAAIAKEHYPERCSRMVIANAPQWFSVVWKMVSPLVDPNTKKKIRITRPGLETLAALREVADDDQIPEIYGGKLRDAHASDLERQLLAKLGKA